MKKVIFVNSCLTNGGSERVMTLIANYFAENNYDTTMILVRDKKEKDYALNQNIECIQFKYNTKNKLIILLKRIIKLRKELKKRKPDYIISFMWDINMITLLANLGLKSKVIVSERAHPLMGPQPLEKKITEKKLYKLANTIVFQTNDVLKYYNKKVKKKSIVIPNPINENLPQKYEGERKKIICAAGRLTKQKNFSMLINVFSKFSKEYNDFKLVIYGDGKLRPELEKQIETLNLKGKAFLPGYIDNINEKMCNCAMYISTSIYEGISNSMLEALGMGIPTICTDCPVGGASLVMKGKNNGILIPVNDDNALLSAMKSIADNKELAEAYSKEALKVRDEFSIDKIGKQWMKLCE